MKEKQTYLNRKKQTDLASQRQHTMMRAQGKLKGFDVFSWMQPDQNALLRFIESVPSSIVWVGNPAEIAHVLSDQPALISKIKGIFSFGENHTGFMLENEYSSIEMVLNGLMSELQDSGTLLFTCTQNDSEYVSLKINAYLNLVQLI